MTEVNNEISTTTSVHSVLTSYDFHAIEAINSFYAENGWDSDYRQIEPGNLEIKLQALELGHIELFRERLNRQIESSATSPEHACSLVMALSDVPFRISGKTVGRNDLLLIAPNTRLNIVAGAGVDALTIHVPIDSCGDYLAPFGGIDSPVDLTYMTLQHTPTMNIDKFRAMVISVFADPKEASAHGYLPRTLIMALTDMLTRLNQAGDGRDPYGRLEKHRILVRARSFVHGHLSDEIRMKDLCEYVGVSLSTLERVFKRELDMSPRDYVLATRLHEARRTIWSTKAESVTIADIALGCGFTHMGRFSGQYRDHFGRLPSDDRQRGDHFNSKDRLT